MSKKFYLDTETQYSVLSKLFHWIRAILIIAIFVAVTTKAFSHKVVGVYLFIFIVLNIIFRLFNKYPKSYAGSNLEANIEKLVHIFMYTIIFFAPILGYLASFKPINLGFLQIPSVYSFNGFSGFLTNVLHADINSFRNILGFFHVCMVSSLFFLIIVHVIVIIFNRIFRKTGELKRMI